MQQLGIYQALSKPMCVALRDNLYEKANAIADGEGNPCDAAIASKLCMDGEEGRFALDLAVDAVWQLKRPQVVDYLEGLAQEYAKWDAQRGVADPSLPFEELARKRSGTGRSSEITVEQGHAAQLMEARQEALIDLRSKHYDADIKAVQLQMEKRRQQAAGKIVEFTQSEINRDLDYERARVNLDADFRDRIGDVSTRIGTLLLKDRAMEEYRLPLAKCGCEAFIEARKNAGLCAKAAGRKSRIHPAAGQASRRELRSRLVSRR
jgi:hypothetical protein